VIFGIDTETTGLDLATVKVCQLGLVETDAQGYEPGQQTSALINPGCPIPAEAAAIHGITDQAVASAPTFANTWPAYADRFQAASALLGYNLRTYDIPLLNRECADAGYLFPTLPVIDVYDLICWHRRALRKRSLGEVCSALGIAHPKQHDAVGDILAALAVLRALQRSGDVPTDLPALLIHCARIAVLIDAEWARWSYYLYDRGEGVRIGFGREIGARVSDLSAGWLGWALRDLRDAPETVRSLWRAELDRRVR